VFEILKRTWRIEQVIGVLLVLVLALIAPSFMNSGEATVFLLSGGIVGFLVFRSRGMVGVLVLIAATTWYPVTSGVLGRLIPPVVIDALSLGGLFILIAGAITIALYLFMADSDVKTKVLPVVIFIIVMGWALTIFSAKPSDTLSSLVRILNNLFLFGLCVFYIKTARQANIICWAIVISVTVSLLIVYLGQYVVALPFSDGTYGPVFGTFGPSDRLLGAYTFPGALAVSYWGPTASGIISMILMLPLTYWFDQRSQGWFKRLLIAGLIILLGVISIKTGGRGGWLGIMAGVLVVGILGLKFRVWTGGRFIVQFAILIVLIGVLGVYQYVRDPEFVTRINSLSLLSEDSAVQDRFGFWQTALNLFTQHPLGIGFNSIQAQTKGYYEHNLFLYMLDGLGPIGLSALFWLWGWIAFRCLRVIRLGTNTERILALASVACMVALFVSGFSEAWPFFSEVSWIFWGSVVGLSNQFV
jgi:O-antigen ligase